MPPVRRLVTGLLVMAGIALMHACADSPTRASCSYALSPTSQAVSASGGAFQATMTTAAACQWSATVNASWVTLETPSGTGPGPVVFRVAANDASSMRAAALSAQGQGLEIRQEAQQALNCTFALSPASVAFGAGGGAAPLAVTAPGGCRWTATTSDAWISLAGAAGEGNGPMIVSVGPNPGGSTRTGAVQVGNQSVRVTQAGAGCDYAVSPTSRGIGAAGGRFDVTIDTSSSCDWQADANDGWLSVSPARGTGSGQVTVDVAAHSASSSRTGTLSIAGQTVSVTQSAVTACAFSVSPQAQPAPVAGGSFSVNVTTTAGCAWTASSNAPWVTITSGQSGTGSGLIGYVVAANTSTSARTATLQIADETVTIAQPGAAPTCSYSVAPTAQAVPMIGGRFQVTVSTTATCQWTASSNAPWITITSGSPGTGTGTVAYSVTANTSQANRTGTLTVAGQTVTVTQSR